VKPFGVIGGGFSPQGEEDRLFRISALLTRSIQTKGRGARPRGQSRPRSWPPPTVMWSARRCWWATGKRCRA